VCLGSEESTTNRARFLVRGCVNDTIVGFVVGGRITRWFFVVLRVLVMVMYCSVDCFGIRLRFDFASSHCSCIIEANPELQATMLLCTS
jgi:hypothetical protein